MSPILVLRNLDYDTEGREEGNRRSARAIAYGRRHRNDLDMDRSLANLQDENSATGERYLKGYLDPIEWNAIHDIDGTADLGGWIDAKTTNRPYPYPFDGCHLLHWAGPRDPPPYPAWAYVLVVPDDHDRGYWLVGWEWGDVLIRAEVKAFHRGRPAFAIRGNVLRPVRSLLAVHRQDRAFAIDFGRLSDYETSRNGPERDRRAAPA